MARKKRRKKNTGLRHAGAVGGLAQRYYTLKREYHSVGSALYRARHGGRSIGQSRRRKRTKHRRSR